MNEDTMNTIANKKSTLVTNFMYKDLFQLNMQFESAIYQKTHIQNQQSLWDTLFRNWENTGTIGRS